jgi:hypothetical protein
LSANKIAYFKSDSFGVVVQFEKESLTEHSWYWQGTLLNDWSGFARTHGEDNNLGWFDLKKGQTVWISKSYFFEINEDEYNEYSGDQE